MQNPISTGKFFPVIITEKFEETKQFYISLLGCQVVFDTDWYAHLVSPKGLEVGILVANHPSQPEYLHRAYTGSGMVLSFDVENADTEYEKVKAAGIEIAYDIKSENWGQRHFLLRDPNGLTVDIVQLLK